MEIKEILELSGVVLGSIGGGVAIIFGFSSWLGKVWANEPMGSDSIDFNKKV